MKTSEEVPVRIRQTDSRAAAGCVVTLFSSSRARPPAPRPNALRVAAVQMRSVRDLDANLARIDALLAVCAGQGVQLAAFPEFAITRYDAASVQAIPAPRLLQAERLVSDACRRHKVHALIGTPWRNGPDLYNAALIIDRKGRIRGRHTKVHLVQEDRACGCRAGERPSPVFAVEGVPCAVYICHDSRYPELVRLPVLRGARVLFYLSHETSLRKESKLGPHRAQDQARAAENNVFVVHANAPADPDFGGSHGQSRIVAPDGNLIGEASQFEEEVLCADLDLAEATGSTAARSLEAGPLAAWWREGMKLVRRLP